MNIKIGDKVRYLNSVGGGIVTRFINKDVVSVEEADGFETPTLIRECVVIETASEIKLKENDATASKDLTMDTTTIIPSVKVNPMVIETPQGEKVTLVLAYLPIDIKALQTSAYECFLVNNSNYYISFTYLNKQNDRWNLRFAGTVEPNKHLFLEEFSKGELNELERIGVQYIPFKSGKEFTMKPTGFVEYRMDVTRFYKLHAFRENDYFEDEAIIVPIVMNDTPQSSDPSVHVDSEKLISIMQEKKREDRPIRKRAEKPMEDPKKPMEVDLHIDELIDTVSGMDNAAILEYQLGHVEEVMRSHAKAKGKRIVFIHGKGEGVLRMAVLKLLKEKFPTCQTQDASFKEYGFGATMVTIR